MCAYLSPAETAGCSKEIPQILIMKKISKCLTDYVIDKELIEEEDRSIYEYGFTVALELGIFIILCIMVMVSFHMYFEGILFFLIFVPLRSYAGGLHLQRYCSCLILSTLTFGGIIAVGRMIQLPLVLAAVISFAALVGIYWLYPVENVNRKVDQQENVYFRRKLRFFLMIDAVLIVIFYVLGAYRGLWIIALTLIMVFVTMLMGKCKNRMQKTETGNRK